MKLTELFTVETIQAMLTSDLEHILLLVTIHMVMVGMEGVLKFTALMEHLLLQEHFLLVLQEHRTSV